MEIKGLLMRFRLQLRFIFVTYDCVLGWSKVSIKLLTKGLKDLATPIDKTGVQKSDMLQILLSLWPIHTSRLWDVRSSQPAVWRCWLCDVALCHWVQKCKLYGGTCCLRLHELSSIFSTVNTDENVWVTNLVTWIWRRDFNITHSAHYLINSHIKTN
jgi:hypothetical protein